MDSKIILASIAGICILLIFGKRFLFPAGKIMKLIINSFFGGFFIFIINTIGTSFNFHIGLNWINSIIVGILGIPGACLLVIVKIFCL